jgi:hypothetical protein
MITYNSKTEVWNALWICRPAVDTAIREWRVKQITITKWKKDIKAYVIVKEAIIYLLS